MNRRDRETATTWQVASLLLGYPDAQWRAELPVLAAEASALPEKAAAPLRRFLDHVAVTDPTELASDYVETFDSKRRCCLYLTYYAHGDTRNRGMALLNFKTAYRAAGLVLTDAELPDHLAVLLEFGATADLAEGRRLLLENRAGFELLRLALKDAGSPWADVVQAVATTLPVLRGDEHEAARRLAAQGPPAEEVGLLPYGPTAVMPETSGARR